MTLLACALCFVAGIITGSLLAAAVLSDRALTADYPEERP